MTAPAISAKVFTLAGQRRDGLPASKVTPQSSAPSRKALRFVLERPHAPDCRALEAVARGDWETPWSGVSSPHPDDYAFRDRLGRRNHGSTMWRRIICNSTNCTATILVNLGAVLEDAPHGTNGALGRTQPRKRKQGAR